MKIINRLGKKLIAGLMILALALGIVLPVIPTDVNAASNPASFIFDISDGSIGITDGTSPGTIKINYGSRIIPVGTKVVDNVPATTQITIIGTALSDEDRLVVYNCVPVVNLTIDNVLMDITYNDTPFRLSNARVNLSLVGTNSFTAGSDYAGIEVDQDSTLTIGGTGSLTATGDSTASTGGAGIGGNSGASSGEIIINSGTITANGGIGGAGIGGGDLAAQGGAITINGGTVTANGSYAAGIGGGYEKSGGVITINDGTVIANGGQWAAGIGGGGGGFTTTAGVITINGGTVTATGGNAGAGIGGGTGDMGGTITITSGTIIATSTGGSGIGNTSSANNTNYGTITITGGSITATGTQYYPGIGGGTGGTGGSITISGGTITATGGERGGAGIGGRQGSSSGTITITGEPFITAQGGNGQGAYGGGAGIGGGGNNTTTIGPVGVITISAGVDLSRIQGGAAASGTGTGLAGAAIGTGGGRASAVAVSYNLHTITYHSNASPDVTQELTYTINGGNSDAVSPSLAYIQLYNPAFVPTTFDAWFDNPAGTGTPFAVGFGLTNTGINALWANGISGGTTDPGGPGGPGDPSGPSVPGTGIFSMIDGAKASGMEIMFITLGIMAASIGLCLVIKKRA